MFGRAGVELVVEDLELCPGTRDVVRDHGCVSYRLRFRMVIPNLSDELGTGKMIDGVDVDGLLSSGSVRMSMPYAEKGWSKPTSSSLLYLNI